MVVHIAKRLPADTVNYTACFLLFLCITFISSFYYGITAEYDYNQKIDRGFISRDALFFSIQERADEDAGQLVAIGDSSSYEGKSNQNTTIVSSQDTEFIIDSLLQVAEGREVFLSSQDKTTRAVFYREGVGVPPLVSGRFFSSGESLADQKLAVIGKNFQVDTWVDSETKKTYITVFDVPYEVIGVVGLDTASTIDDLIYVNLGSLSDEKLIAGRFCLDGDKKTVQDAYSSFCELVQGNSIYQVSEILMPATATDVVAGGIFMADILQIVIYLFLCGTYVCVLMFFLLSILQKVTVMLLNGFSYSYIVALSFLPQFLSGSVGILVSMVTYFILWKAGVFALPTAYFVPCMVRNGFIGISLLLLWILPIYIIVRRFKLAESLR